MWLTGPEVQHLPCRGSQFPIMGVSLDAAPRYDGDMHIVFGVVVLGQHIPHLLKGVHRATQVTAVPECFNQQHLALPPDYSDWDAALLQAQECLGSQSRSKSKNLNGQGKPAKSP